MGAARSAGGLRGELTEFVGRRAELARVRDALEGARLVTLTGPGGIGKTRLALQVAAGAGRAFRDGVWLTELSGLRDPGLLVGEVARSLGLSDRSARWAVASLADYLENRQLLLVLDGCEHLADACAVMADALLRGCPGLRIIATSRHVLGVAGEVTTAVPPMTVPAEGDPAGPEELLGYEAVRLFAGRGAAVLPGFAVDVGNGAAVAGGVPDAGRDYAGGRAGRGTAAVIVAGADPGPAGLAVPVAVPAAARPASRSIGRCRPPWSGVTSC